MWARICCLKRLSARGRNATAIAQQARVKNNTKFQIFGMQTCHVTDIHTESIHSKKKWTVKENEVHIKQWFQAWFEKINAANSSSDIMQSVWMAALIGKSKKYF